MPRFTSDEVKTTLAACLRENAPVDGERGVHYERRIVSKTVYR